MLPIIRARNGGIHNEQDRNLADGDYARIFTYTFGSGALFVRPAQHNGNACCGRMMMMTMMMMVMMMTGTNVRSAEYTPSA